MALRVLLSISVLRFLALKTTVLLLITANGSGFLAFFGGGEIIFILQLVAETYKLIRGRFSRNRTCQN